MKLADIEPGMVIRTAKKYGATPRLVLAKGRYVVTRNPDRDHVITWRGRESGLSMWFMHEPAVKQNRVVVLDLSNGLGSTLSTLPVSGIATIIPEYEVLRLMQAKDAEKFVSAAYAEHNRVRVACSDTIRGVVMDLVKMPETTRKQNRMVDPYLLLSKNHVLMDQMVLLWLHYCDQRDIPVGEDADLQSVIDEYQFAARYLRDATDTIVAETAEIRKFHAIDPTSEEWQQPLKITPVEKPGF